MRKEILAIILVLLVPWELNRRNTVIQSPEVHHVDQEEGEGIVEPTQKPAEIPLIFKILYPWAVPRDVVKGVPETPMEDPRNVIVGAPDTRMEEIVETTPQPAKIPLVFRILYPWAVLRDFIRGVPETPMEEENTKRAEQPVEETVREIENDRPEPISWFSFLTCPPFWFSWAFLICVLILKYVLRQNDLARILRRYLMFLQLSGLINLLIDIWSSRGPAFEYVIQELINWFLFLTRTPFFISLALLICVLILKYVLHQNHLAKALGRYLMILLLCGIIYLVIGIWSSRGTSVDDLIMELICLVSFLTRTPSWFNWLGLICVFILRRLLHQNDLATILGYHLEFLQLCGFIYLLIDVWNSRGTSFEDLTLEPISWFSFLTRPPFWLSWAVLFCALVLKHILHQSYLARILKYYLKFLQLSGVVYLLIDIWNRRGPAFENIILPLYINAGDWYHRVVARLWAVWSKGCVAFEDTVPPLLIDNVTEHRLECFLGVIIMLVALLLIYFKPFYRLFRPTSSNITPPTSENVESTMEDHIGAYQRDFCRPVKKRRQTNYLRAPLRRRMKRSKPRIAVELKNINFLQKRAVIPPGDDTIPPTRDVTLIPPMSKNGESAMEVTGSPIPRVAPHRFNIWDHIRDSCRPIKKRSATKAFGDSNIFPPSDDILPTSENVVSSMEETDVPVSRVAPPRASFSARLRQRIKKLKTKMVAGHRKLFPRKSDITPPTIKNAPSAMEETDVPIPSVAPTRNNTKPWSSEILPTTPAMDSSLGPQWRTFFVHPSITRRRKNVDSSMEETDVPVPSIASTRNNTKPWSSEILPTTPAMDSSLGPQWRTFFVHPSIARRRKNVDSSMEETDVPIPSVAPPRDQSNVTPQNGGRLSLPSSLVTDDINMLLDSSISQQRATLAVVPNVETRSNQTRLHLRELFRLVKKRKATKEDRQES